MIELTNINKWLRKTVRDFVEREVIPVATDSEHRNEYPHALVETMKALGLFGLNVPDEYGGNEIDYTTFAMVFEELSRGWMGLAGIIGSHSVLCDVLVAIRYGRPEATISASPGERRTARRHLPFGTERRDRSPGHHDCRSPRWRYLLRHGFENVGDQRPAWADLSPAREDRSRRSTAASRHERFRDRKGSAGPDRRARYRARWVTRQSKPSICTSITFPFPLPILSAESKASDSSK